MQNAMDFGRRAELGRVRSRLVWVLGSVRDVPRRSPMGQLAKSLISNKTYDAVSLAAYRRLGQRYCSWSRLAKAKPEEILPVIATVTHPESKARHLAETLRRIQAERPDFRLEFLGEYPVDTALAWLERLPGVGRKVAASTLNFSTLRKPAFVLDTHVLRVLGRLGFWAEGTRTERAYQTIMEALPDWSADDLAEFHCLVKRLGQIHCHKDLPDCPACPLERLCRNRNRSWK